MDYTTANTKLGSRDSRKVGNNTYLQRRGDGSIALKLHATDVLTFHADGRTVYQSGGYLTVTTKARMNEYGPLRLCTERGVWYVYPSPGNWDTRLVYADGLTVNGDGSISGQGTALDERGDKRAIKKYVAAYMAAFEAGEVPAPSWGDCWYCSIREINTGKPLGEVWGGQRDHIRGHFTKPYYVPSILARALELFGASPAARNWVAAYWDTSAPVEVREQVKGSNFYAQHGRETCAKVLQRYLSRQLGYAA